MKKSTIQIAFEAYTKSKVLDVDNILDTLKVSHRSFRYYLKSKGTSLYDITPGLASEIEESYHDHNMTMKQISAIYIVPLHEVSEIANHGISRFLTVHEMNELIKQGVPTGELRAKGYHCGTTEQEKEEINKLIDTGRYTNEEIAKMFNLSPGRISQIKKNKVKRKKYSYLSAKVKAEIRNKKAQGVSADTLATDYNISRSQVYNICRGN